MQEGLFTLRDLKRNKHLAGTLFNILFNLNKFVAFETRDPFTIRQVSLLLGACNSLQCCPVSCRGFWISSTTPLLQRCGACALVLSSLVQAFGTSRTWNRVVAPCSILLGPAPW